MRDLEPISSFTVAGLDAGGRRSHVTSNVHKMHNLPTRGAGFHDARCCGLKSCGDVSAKTKNVDIHACMAAASDRPVPEQPAGERSPAERCGNTRGR